jgi:hypothetical protein
MTVRSSFHEHHIPSSISEHRSECNDGAAEAGCRMSCMTLSSVTARLQPAVSHQITLSSIKV